MNTTQTILREAEYCEGAVLYMAFELSHKTWRLVFSAGGKERQVSMEARNLMRLEEESGKAKKIGLPEEAQVRSCYEAGRDGFWLHRYLVSRGIENVVLESASIEVDRRAREDRSAGWGEALEAVGAPSSGRGVFADGTGAECRARG